MYNNDDKEYVSMRITDTIVRDIRINRITYVKGVIEDDEGTMRIHCKGFETGVSYTTKLENLDLTSPPLGNVVYEGDVYYVSRQPKRNDWRQGLRKENLCYTRKGNTRTYRLPSLDILDTPIFNKYPSYKESIHLISVGYQKECAFGRCFSLDKGKKLWYKQRMRVGGDEHGVPTLMKKFSWLQEALDDELEN